MHNHPSWLVPKAVLISSPWTVVGAQTSTTQVSMSVLQCVNLELGRAFTCTKHVWRREGPKFWIAFFQPKVNETSVYPRSFPKCVCICIASIYDSHLLVTLMRKIKRSIYRQGIKKSPHIYVFLSFFSLLLDSVDIGHVSSLLTYILYIYTGTFNTGYCHLKIWNTCLNKCSHPWLNTAAILSAWHHLCCDTSQL